MPNYSFRCRSCGDTFEVNRPMAQSSDPASCPAGHDDTVKLLTTFAAVHAGLTEYDPEVIHHSRISLADLHVLCGKIAAMTVDERMTLGPMHPGRADVIGGGALVTRELARQFADRAGITEMVVSEHDILDGIALGLVP